MPEANVFNALTSEELRSLQLDVLDYLWQQTINQPSIRAYLRERALPAILALEENLDPHGTAD